METKKWWQSLTIWGVAIMGLCGLILPLLGQAEYARFLNEEQAGIMTWLGALGEVIGGLMAFYGRFRAVRKIV